MLQVRPMQIDTTERFAKALSLTLYMTKRIYAEVLACDCNVIQYSLTSCFIIHSCATRVGTGLL